MNKDWPELSYAKGKDTYETIHMWTQIVGKIKLAQCPWINHSWHVTLHISPRGLTTKNMSWGDLHFQIDFDFVAHRLEVSTSRGERVHFDLQGLSVADFYQKIFATLEGLGITIKITTTPSELPDPIPFPEDNVHSTYDPDVANALHRALLKMEDCFNQVRCDFKGKCSPVHFFWGGFDLAVSRFSGRRAPKHPGGIPNMPDWVAEDAYSHEVASFGFWPGNEALPEAAFYSYLYPEPENYSAAAILPEGAYYHTGLREFVLPYDVVQGSKSPESALGKFLKSTYAEGARLAHWDRKALES